MKEQPRRAAVSLIDIDTTNFVNLNVDYLFADFHSHDPRVYIYDYSCGSMSIDQGDTQFVSDVVSD